MNTFSFTMLELEAKWITRDKKLYNIYLKEGVSCDVLNETTSGLFTK